MATRGRGAARLQASGWKRIRMQVKARAHGRCEECGLKVGDRGFCDHKKNRAEGGTDGMDNLQWLCPPCHDAKTKTEVARGNRRKAGRGRYTQGSHPGLSG